MFSTLLSTAAIVATASAAFDPLSKNNVITYWGQGANQARLVETCKNSAYDIINVGFVNVFPDQGEGGWPGTNFGNACWGDVYQNAQGVNTSLLKTCPYIGEDVITCQQTYGKKIFLSLGGGSKPQYYIKSVQSARNFANFLWAAFGPASASTPDVPRPWGDAGVDGFDFDIESIMNPAPTGSPNYQKAFYTDMIKRFKTGLFPTDTSKSYYISGAPQCSIPDPHFTDVIAAAWFDFLFIQFYNTDGCSARDGVKKINGKGTADISYLQWVASKSLNPNVRMSIGLPAAKPAAIEPTYYLTPAEAQKLIKKFYKQKLFGGVMLWEATTAANNKPCSTDYGTWMKNILNGQASGKDISTACANKRDVEAYAPEYATTSSSTSCTVTSTITRSSSSLVFPSAPVYANTSSPVTTSAPVYSISKSYADVSSSSVESASSGLCTSTTTLIYRTGSETSTYVAPCESTCTASTSGSVPAYTPTGAVSSSTTESPPASSPPVPSYPSSPEESSPAASSPAGSYPSSPEESSPAVSSPASPAQSSPAASYPASGTCGAVTVTVKEQSTVYVTAGATESVSSEDVTSLTTIQSTSTVYNTHTKYMTAYPSAPAGGEGEGEGYGSPAPSSSPAGPESSGYENSPVGGSSGSTPYSSTAPAAPPAYTPSHGHQHGGSHSHSHGHGHSSSAAGAYGSQNGANGPQSTTTVVSVVTVVPVPVTSSPAAQVTGAAVPYPYGPAGGNGTAASSASASGSAWPSYGGPMQQTGGASGLGGGMSGGLAALGLVAAVALL